jgi:Bacterial regulatory proteins, tetR family
MPRSAEQTRKQILDGAYRLFRRRGYSRVTMDDIAARTAGGIPAKPKSGLKGCFRRQSNEGPDRLTL